MLLISFVPKKTTEIVVFNAPWKTYYHRVYRGTLTDIEVLMHRGKLTDIVVFNAAWKTYYHSVYRGKITIIVCTVENLLTSCVLWKTD